MHEVVEFMVQAWTFIVAMFGALPEFAQLIVALVLVYFAWKFAARILAWVIGALIFTAFGSILIQSFL